MDNHPHHPEDKCSVGCTPRGLKVVNGFTIIATRPVRVNRPEEGTVILGARDQLGTSTGFEYVTSVMRSLDQSHWDASGHYFYRLGSALHDFNTRC